MINIRVNNKYAYIRGARPGLVKDLEKLCSYLVAGFMHTVGFKNKRWDGKEHLLVFVPRKGHRVPAGLLRDVVERLDMRGKKYIIKCEKRWHNKKIRTTWNGNIVLRDYQNEAVEAITTGRKWEVGSGLLKMPIRSGKTKTAAGIIHTMKRRTLFIVPSLMLLHQTVESLNESLCTEVGIIGDGNWEPRDITVATVQTLARYSGGTIKQGKKYIEIPPADKFVAISESFDMIIMDECHHLVAENWKNIVAGFNCRCKIGLSASIHFENSREVEKGAIWLKACCGDVRYEIPMQGLVEAGYLMKQQVELHKITEPQDYYEWRWSKELNDVLIYENEYRNALIAAIVEEKLDIKLKVLVISNRMNQLAELHSMLIARNIGHAVVTGQDAMSARKRKVKAFLKNEINVLLGTVFGEGVDIPEIECVVNAEGGRDVKRTIQRMRNMTPSDGKTAAVFVDFADLTHKHFAIHSRDRIDVYRAEPAFEVKIID